MQYIWLIPLLPGLGAAINGLVCIRSFSRKTAGYLACTMMVAALGLALIAFWQLLGLPGDARAYDVTVAQWIPVIPLQMHSGSFGQFQVTWGFRLDPLSGMMLLVVTGIGTLIHIYSTAYMADEPRGGVARFFCYLNLFCFFMLILVLGDNFLVMFVGWEGVGLSSYLLIGYWYEKKSAADAGKKAFITNRIGDWGFVLGVFLIFSTFGTLDFRAVQNAAFAMPTETAHFGVLSAICLLLFVGAIGKSAQIPLYVWLPDAMEGPTPVSALIHAATMVTAGVYMVGRNAVLFSHAPMVMQIIAIVGVLTALMAASIGLVQYDIKRVLAYSTVSQLGYMFLAMGAGAYAAGAFHLMTHAFFKALLFLGAGSVIHAMSGEQDIQKMGGLWGKIPVTAWTFMFATLAIAGIPPLAGFFSKDEILGRAFERHPALWIVGFITAGMTAFYMFRLVFLTFFGYSRADNHAQKHIHESPRTMTIPLMILAVLSVVGGWIGWPASLFGSNQFEKFLEPVMSSAGATESAKAVQESSTTEYFLMLASIAIAVAGIWVAYEFYRTKRFAPELVAGKMKGFYRVLFHKYYVDEIYDALFVNRTKDLGTLLGQIDAKVIDGVGVDGTGWLARFGSTLSMWWDKWIIDGLLNFGAKFTQLLSFPIRFLQTGTFSTYALLILLGLAILLGYYEQHLHVVLRGAR